MAPVHGKNPKGTHLPQGHPAYNLPDATGPGSLEGQSLGLNPQATMMPGAPMAPGQPM